MDAKANREGRMKNSRAVPKLRLAAATAAILLFGLAPPGIAGDPVLKGEATSVLESYDDPATGEGALPFYQYLRLDISEAGGGGQRFLCYGRLAVDLADQLDLDSRLYAFWYEKRGVFPGTDLRVGRQWVTMVAGSPLIDGLLVRSAFWGLKASAFAGGWVSFDDEAPDAWTWGVQVARDFTPSAEASLSYLQKRVGADLAREYVGGQASLGIPLSGRAFGEFQYDLISKVLDYWLVGARIAPGGRLAVRAEYLGTTPVFDATDIYSVFAVDQYREASLKADYRLGGGWSLFAGYTREFYKDFEDADVAEAGVELRRAKALHGYLSGVFRDGDEDLSGVKAAVGAPVFWEIDAEVGAEVNVYTRTGDPEGKDVSAKRYWVEARRDLGKDFTLAGKAERIESVVYDYYNRGRLSLTYRF